MFFLLIDPCQNDEYKQPQKESAAVLKQRCEVDERPLPPSMYGVDNDELYLMDGFGLLLL